MDLWNLVDSTTVFIFFAILSLVYYLLSPKNLPPGPFPLPVVGNLLQLPRDIQKIPEAFERYAQKYGNIYRLYFGSQLVIVLHGYEMVHEALVKNSVSFSGRPKFWVFEKIGTAVILGNGQQWKDLRRMSLHAMRDFGVGKASIEEKIRDEVNAIIGILSENEGKPFQLKFYLSNATSNVICSIVFGSRFEYEDARFQTLMRLIAGLAQGSLFLNPGSVMPLSRILPSVRKAMYADLDAFTEVRNFIGELVKEHQLTYDSNNIRDFIDMYIRFKDEEDCASYTENNFLQLLADLFTAGTETSSTTLDWALLYMMTYPEVQTKCQEEIDKVVGRGRMIKFTDKEHLPYVNATICEIQRMANLVPLDVPHSNLQDTQLRGYNIPKGSMILPYLGSVLQDPKYWDQPDEFRPERFLNSEGKVIKNEAFIPFSTGPRTCAGETLAKQELFLFFANLLQCFTFSRPEGAKLNLEAQMGNTNSAAPYDLVANRR